LTNPTKVQRWLDLIAYLVARRTPVPGDDLLSGIPAYAERWNSDSETDRQTARRTFERDKDELRRLGIPIRTVRYSIQYESESTEGYQIDRRDFYLPYLKIVSGAADARLQDFSRHKAAEVEIAEADAPLALAALRRVADVPSFPFAAEARSAFRKLAFDIDPLKYSPESRVLFVDRPGSVAVAERVRQLSEALLARKHVRFTYHGIYRDDVTDRTVDLYGLLFQHGNWYAIGFDAARADIRVFRAGRMDNVKVATSRPGTPDYEIPATFDMQAYADREPWRMGSPDDPVVTAEVFFRFPLSLWAQRNHHGTLTARRPDGGTVHTFVVQQVNPFLRWILSLEGEATVLSPPELVAELKSIAQDVVVAHSPAGDAND
jgi:proteasome accessory factor B